MIRSFDGAKYAEIACKPPAMEQTSVPCSTLKMLTSVLNILAVTPRNLTRTFPHGERFPKELNAAPFPKNLTRTTLHESLDAAAVR